MSETTVAIAASVFLVFMVMAIQFESIRFSLLVMLCLPFSLIGAIPLLYVGLPQKVINLSTMVGLLMLGGLSMATILTLIILPVFYLFFCKKDKKDKKDKKENPEVPELKQVLIYGDELGYHVSSGCSLRYPS